MSRSSTKARKERKRERREKEERVTLAPEDALDIIDDDLPDGAYWALMEEMTGMDADAATALIMKAREHWFVDQE